MEKVKLDICGVGMGWPQLAGRVSVFLRPDLSTFKPADMRGIGDKDMVRDRDECFIVAISLPRIY